MLRINRLRIQLPAAWQHRAGDIGKMAGHMLGRSLAQQASADPGSISGSISGSIQGPIKKIAVPRIRLRADATDHDIARSIAMNIDKQLRRRK